MKVTITYCEKWNFFPRASSLGEELKKRSDTEVEYVAGAGGIFTVVADGKEIFSKSKAGRFPEFPEIVTELNKM